jgi:hypothetical protein
MLTDENPTSPTKWTTVARAAQAVLVDSRRVAPNDAGFLCCEWCGSWVFVQNAVLGKADRKPYRPGPSFLHDCSHVPIEVRRASVGRDQSQPVERYEYGLDVARNVVL